MELAYRAGLPLQAVTRKVTNSVASPAPHSTWKLVLLVAPHWGNRIVRP